MKIFVGANLFDSYMITSIGSIQKNTGVNILFASHIGEGQAGGSDYDVYDKFIFIDDNGLVWYGDNHNNLRLYLANIYYCGGNQILNETRGFFIDRDGYFLGDYQNNMFNYSPAFADFYSSSEFLRREAFNKKKLFRLAFEKNLLDVLSKNKILEEHFCRMDMSESFGEFISGIVFDYRESIINGKDFEYSGKIKQLVILTNILFSKYIHGK